MKAKLIMFLLCFAFLNVAGQGTITRNSTRKTEQPAKQNSGKKQQTRNQGQRVSQSQYSRPTIGTENNHEWVDLGLSVKWATCNVGASSPSDYGGYYAWGETTTKSRYDWDNCFDCTNPQKWNEESGWSTYKLGGQTIITPTSGHDTARENWGGTWRMPTDAENEELCKKCTWMWMSQGDHNGYKVTGPNGNSIFLPAAGYYCKSDNALKVGENGFYWSSSLSSSYTGYARGFSIVKGMGNHNRINGQSVRPVTE